MPLEQRPAKASNSLRVTSSLADSNKVRSATSRLMYSFMPFCMMIDWVSATPSNSTLVTRSSHWLTAYAPASDSTRPIPTATDAGLHMTSHASSRRRIVVPS